MARRRQSGNSGQALPSRSELLAYIAEHPGRAGKRDIARAFGITGADRIPLKRMLKELVDEGAVTRRGQRLAEPGALPPVTVLTVTGRNDDGELTAIPTEWSEEEEPPRIIVGKARGRGRNPAIGDRILARLAPDETGSADLVASVIKVLDRMAATVLGVLRQLPDGWRLEPVDRKQRELIVEGDLGKAREGDLVSVELVRRSRFGPPRARLVETVGSMRQEHAVSLIALHTHGIPHIFPSEVLDAADAAKPIDATGRDDWRDIPFVTIDPEDARDHDDAVHAVTDDDPENPGGFVVSVAIADVAHYVHAGQPLDREALKRGNSVYFPDRVVPMLPERISNDLCSLKDGVDRPALAVRMAFSNDGRKLRHRFHRVVIRSAARLSYRQAQTAFDGGKVDGAKPASQALADLWQAYQALKRGRDARSPLDLDLPERKVLLKKDGTIDRIVVPARLEAHRLIEEFMIQANVAAAEALESRKSPLVYRIHDAPSLAKLEALREFLASIEINLPKGGNLRPSHFNRILERVEESDHRALVHEVVLRSQSQAEYSPQNIGHFGLNLRRYAHFTSPIRRYADLVVHRALIRAFRLGPGGLTDAEVDGLDAVAAQISVAERRAMAAERDTIDRLVANWLADRIGATFTGRIAGVTRAGLFVKLDESGADGFVPMSTLGDERFHYDEARHAVIGSASGTMHRLGDVVEVRLVEAAPLAGALRFELLSEGRPAPRGPGRRRGRPAGGRPQKAGTTTRRPAARRRR